MFHILLDNYTLHIPVVGYNLKNESLFLKNYTPIHPLQNVIIINFE